jgi:hypothetical protein
VPGKESTNVDEWPKEHAKVCKYERMAWNNFIIRRPRSEMTSSTAKLVAQFRIYAYWTQHNYNLQEIKFT